MTATKTQYVVMRSIVGGCFCKKCRERINPGEICVSGGWRKRQHYHPEHYTDAHNDIMPADMSPKVESLIREHGGEKIFGAIWSKIQKVRFQ